MTLPARHPLTAPAAALISNNTAVSNSIGQLSNITILAPSNEALNALISGADAATAAQLAKPDFIQAVLSYHILNGTYYASAFSETPAFVPTALINQTYTNVTGGQRVEGVLEDDKVVIRSGLGLESTVTSAVR